MCSSFLVGESSVNGQGGTGDVAALVGDEVENRVADVSDIDQADRHGVLDIRSQFGMPSDKGPIEAAAIIAVSTPVGSWARMAR
jgi:hypothetical protein